MSPQPVQRSPRPERFIKNSQSRPRPVQEILQLDLLCLQQIHQKQGTKRLTAVYRETRGRLRGSLRVGDVPFPAGNFHRTLVPDLAGPSIIARWSVAPPVVDPAELRLAL
jgi:hypothetical protein